jgi:hypothetical protein
MSDISLEKLMVRLNSASKVSQIIKTFKFKQVKLSKQVYKYFYIKFSL